MVNSTLYVSKNQQFKHRHELARRVVRSLEMEAVVDAVEVERNHATTHIGKLQAGLHRAIGKVLLIFSAAMPSLEATGVAANTAKAPAIPSWSLPFQTSLVISTDGSARLRSFISLGTPPHRSGSLASRMASAVRA